MKQQEMYDYIVSLREYIISLEKRIAILEAKLEPKPMSRAIPGTRKRTFTRAGVDSLIEGLHAGGPIRPPSAEDLRFRHHHSH